LREEEAVVTLFILLAIVCLAIIIPSLILRYKKQLLRHRERMAAIEKGADLPPEPPEPSRAIPRPQVYLLRGMLWLFSGIAIAVFLLGLVYSASSTESLETKLRRAERLRELNATEQQIETTINEDRRSGPGPGVALLGLVPVSIGAAYLAFYRSEQARIDSPDLM